MDLSKALMRAPFFLIAFLTFGSSVGFAQTLYRQHSGLDISFLGVSFATDRFGVVCGLGTAEYGEATTLDGGQTWKISDGPRDHNCVRFFDSLTGCVGGYKYVQSFVSGRWAAEPQLPASGGIYGIDYPSADTVIAVGGQGTICKSIDSGKTWTKIEPPKLLANRDFFGVTYFDDSSYWIVGAGGIVLYTEDAGTTWQRIPVPTTNDLYSICFPSDGMTGWIVGDQTLLYTRDAGDTWASIPTTANLRAIDGYDSTGFAVGLHGVLLTTNDLVHWSPIETGTTANFYGLDIPDSLYVVGDSGIILTTLPPPTLRFQVQGIDFGTIQLGGSVHDSLRIQNTG